MPRPQTVPFETWTEKEATELLPKVREEYAANELFVAGDHWQSGTGWVGPRPAQGDAGFSETMALIETGFTARDAISEVVERHANGVVGNEPAWTFAPVVPLKKDQELSPGQESAIDELSAALTVWWDRRKIGQVLWEFARTLCWAERAVLRVYIPPGLLKKEGDVLTAQPADFNDALDHVYVMQPTPKTSGVYVDPKTQQPVGIFITEVDKVKVTELTFAAAEDGGEPGDVVLRVLSGSTAVRAIFKTGGRLLMYEAKRPLMITKPVQQGQRALNLAYSIMPRNIVTGGFLERILLNAQMPGHWETNETTGSRTWVPGEFAGGPGTTQFVKGLEEEDEDGSVKRATPAVVFREPVPVDSSVAAAAAHYRAILDEVDQAHVLLNALSETSGRAREQARADFKASLGRTQQEIEPATRWLLEVVAAIGEMLTGGPGKFTNEYRAVVSCRLDTGPLQVEERAQNVTEVEANLMSRERAMTEIGITDPDGEESAIAMQPDAGLDVIERRATVMQIFTSAGATLLEAAIAAGWDETEAKKLFPDRGPEEPEESNDAAPAFDEAEA